MRKIIAIAILLASASLSKGQLRHELGINVDNDYPYMTDKYYSAGQDIYYRSLWNNAGLFSSGDSLKTIFTLHYGNKIFTPRDIDTHDPHFMDRPYCGWNFIGAEARTFNRKNSSNFFGLQVGVVGQASGMGQAQQWLHQTIQLYNVEGWETQIKNEVVINTQFNHAHGFRLAKNAELVSVSSASLGTGSNKLSQEITLRLFRFEPLSRSVFLDAGLNAQHKKNKPEFFVFGSIGGDYVFSNIFIEGSLFEGNASPYTMKISPLVLFHKVGVRYSADRVSLGLILIHVGNETALMGSQNYASANAAYRF